ncbi:superoxide dismutase [Gorgonomyces haynaldii]|nr:superoxide dismutase [Gorgonomyces haynaldii]
MSDFKEAYVRLVPHLGQSVFGNGTIVQESSSDFATIHLNIQGLVPNTLHGLHIHSNQVDSLNGTADCLLAGGHYNPYSMDHGAPEDVTRHVGDLGNILSDDNGAVDFFMTDRLVTLFGPKNVLSRTFVVHADPDDYGKGEQDDSKTTGHAGKRLSCGSIILRK